MIRRRDNHEFIAMDEHNRQPVVCDGKRNYAEVDRIVDDGLKNLAIIGTFDVHRDIGILLLEVGEDSGRILLEVALFRSSIDFAGWNALLLGEVHQMGLPASRFSSTYS